jgi:hypothetical protein
MQDVARAIFNQLVDMLWTDVVLPAMHRSTRSKASGDSAQEDALYRWISSLDVANDRLAMALPRVEGYTPRLLPLAQVALLSRIDFLFHQNILALGSDVPLKPAEQRGWAVPNSMLPFALDGHVTFKTGMQLKMAVMHLTEWANKHDVRDNESAVLCPYMRSVADTLMMKKDLLLDPDTRASVCAGLSMHSLLHILQKFAADEFSPTPIDPAIIEELQRIAARSPKKEDTLQPYTPPNIYDLLESAEREAREMGCNRRRGHQLSLAQMEVQIGDDSDVELQEMAAAHQPHGSRFLAVEDLWAKTHDRRAE